MQTSGDPDKTDDPMEDNNPKGIWTVFKDLEIQVTWRELVKICDI